jgi:protein O-GlcNAc transferase
VLIPLLRRLTPQRKSSRLLAEAQKLLDAGKPDEAERIWAGDRPADARVLQDFIALHFKLADAFQALRRYEDESRQLERVLELLAATDPTRPRVMLRLAGALRDCGHAAEAEVLYRKILEIEPDNRDTLLCLAVAREESSVEEAREIMVRYISLQPGSAAPRLRRALMLAPIAQSNDEIEEVRHRLDRELDEVLEKKWPAIPHPEFEIGSTAFALAYHGRNDAGLMRKLGRACRSVYAARSECPRRPPSSGSRLKIGFVSAHFHTHSIARTTHGLIQDLRRDRFEVSAFAIAPRQDEWAETIRRSADRYVSLPLDLDRVRETIDAAALDVLFFADIGMEALTYFLAFWRLAPVQVVTWGHPVTTGIDTIDHFISADALEAQGSEDQYTENLIRLPGYFLPRYRRPALDAPRKTRAELGLPEGRHLYYCLQNLFKLHPDFDAAIKAILELDPEGELVLLESHDASKELLRRRFSRTLGPLAAKIRFLPRTAHRDFLQHVAVADVVLDPFHFGGNNSTCEALSLGIPVVTLPAFQLRGRFTLGLYRELGLDSCIARSAEEFVSIAVRLGTDPGYRRQVSEQIAARCARLFDRPDAAFALGDELVRLAEAAR